MSEKTEQPSAKKLSKAAQEGDIATSAALIAGCAFLAAAQLVPSAMLALWARSSALLTSALTANVDLNAAEAQAMAALLSVVVLSAPILAIAAVVAALVGGLQAGGVFAPSKLIPDLSKLSPASGLQSLFSAHRWLAVLRAAVTLGLFLLMARARVRTHLPAVLTSAHAAEAAGLLGELLLRDAATLLLVSGLVDLVLTRRAYIERMKMTKTEVQQEAKESDGDPQLKAARERAHHELLSQASINAVRDATVVIVNPTHLATALRYLDGEDQAPTVLAKGEGAIAARIIAAAHHYGVPVVQDIPLAHALRELEVGEEIPEALYETVAEVLRSLWETEATRSE